MKVFRTLLITSILSTASVVFGQTAQTTPTSSVDSTIKTVKAKYEGGMFGFSKSEKGNLKLDDESARLVFLSKDNKEKFSIPYGALLVVYPQSKSVTSTTGRVVGVAPLPGARMLGSLIKENRRYLVLNFDDPDVAARGTVSFKLDNKEILNSVIEALGKKASLAKRGDAFFRPRRGDNSSN